MAGTTRTRTSKALRAMSTEAKAAYSEVQKSVNDLGKTIAEIRRNARRAERKIETDARLRIRALRKEARGQLAQLQSRQRDASRTLRKLSGAAGESWREIKHSADSIVADARAAARRVLDRFRSALGV